MMRRWQGMAAVLGAVTCFFANPGGAADKNHSIILQSTTSTANSGLYDYILPIFEKKTGITVNVVAVGTGQALKNARRGDGDVLLVHAKPLEEKFVAEGFGLVRHDVMYNDFVVVGPKGDPAEVSAVAQVKTGFARIADKKAPFVSRGDNSGTHIKELNIWRASGVNPAKSSGTWYRETGSGMGATLNIAVAMGAYVLTDRATWLKFGNKRDHRILLRGDPSLFNQYGVILVSPQKHPRVKVQEGQQFIDWLLSPAGQNAIGRYRIKGQTLFFPNHKKNK